MSILTDGYSIVTNGVVNNPSNVLSQSAFNGQITDEQTLAIALTAPYKPNTLTYLTSTYTQDNTICRQPAAPAAVLPYCSNDLDSGSCLGGSVYYDQPVTLQSNLFVLGNIIMNPGGLLITNGHSIITNEIVDTGTSTLGPTIISGYSTTGGAWRSRIMEPWASPT